MESHVIEEDCGYALTSDGGPQRLEQPLARASCDIEGEIGTLVRQLWYLILRRSDGLGRAY